MDRNRSDEVKVAARCMYKSGRIMENECMGKEWECKGKSA
jgi:hypothetical protein